MISIKIKSSSLYEDHLIKLNFLGKNGVIFLKFELEEFMVERRNMFETIPHSESDHLLRQLPIFEFFTFACSDGAPESIVVVLESYH